jgi:2-polyprenyl-3-methyl-5-hydroxy-6-metoxy-1,4-benzoquinol methylase
LSNGFCCASLLIFFNLSSKETTDLTQDHQDKTDSSTQGTKEHVCPFWMGYLLNLPVRKLFESPKKLLGPLVEPGMTVLEPGCAMGYFSMPLARMVGTKGRVICVDLQEKMIKALRRRAKRAGLLDRLETTVCEKNSLGLDKWQGQVDLVCAMHVVHEMPDPAAFLEQVFDVLKPGGKLLVMEPKSHVSVEDFQAMCLQAEQAGFTKSDYPSLKKRLGALFEK